VEDFLAAVDYELPAVEPGQVGIRTAAGPSVFGRHEAGLSPRLLQVALQAGPAKTRALQAAHLTVAVDVSASMRWGGRMEMTRRALRRLVGQLGRHDFMSLVSFNERAYVDEELRGSSETDDLLAAIDRLRPKGGTNIGEGLRVAASVAMQIPSDSTVTSCLVLMTDGVSGVSEETATKIEQMLADDVAASGVTLHIIDFGDRGEGDPLLARFAAAGGGRVIPAETAEQIRWTLVEILTGSSSLVAADTALQVTFNPKAVAAYRLLGHAPGAAGLMCGMAQTDLRSGQAATALFEVWLLPDGEDDVGVAEVTWRDPGSGETHARRQRISRLQFAASFAESPLPLQAATVAAETAEILRESYFVASSTRDLTGVLEVAQEVNPHLARRPSFAEFVSVVQQAERVRHRRRSGSGR